jgi:predicted ArsR family transcriptional regulator
VIDYIKNHPDTNASTVARKVAVHVVTAQRILDTMEKYGFLTSQQKRTVGRPSKIYRYVGGSYTINMDELLALYKKRDNRVRETGRMDVMFSYDVDRELINAVLIGGKKGIKHKMDEKQGRLLWLVPPPDSKGESIGNLAKETGTSLLEAVQFCEEMLQLGVIEEAEQ